jgi:hypothetical protein
LLAVHVGVGLALELIDQLRVALLPAFIVLGDTVKVRTGATSELPPDEPPLPPVEPPVLPPVLPPVEPPVLVEPPEELEELPPDDEPPLAEVEDELLELDVDVSSLTVVLTVVVPLALVQASEKAVVFLIGSVSWLPFAFLTPDHPPDAAQTSAFLVFQVRVAVLPDLTDVAEVVRVMVGFPSLPPTVCWSDVSIGVTSTFSSSVVSPAADSSVAELFPECSWMVPITRIEPMPSKVVAKLKAIKCLKVKIFLSIPISTPILRHREFFAMYSAIWNSSLI